MHVYLNWFEAHKSIYVGLHHPVLCSFNKGYYLCGCNISFSRDAGVLQGCTFIEKSISKHIFAEPLRALLLVWKASVWWCVRSGLILCVCVCQLFCVFNSATTVFFSSKESLCSGKQHNPLSQKKTQTRKDSVSDLV